jgi:hypothetical protein
MHSIDNPLYVMVLGAALGAFAVHPAIAQEGIERPSLGEIRNIEAKVKMPRRAASLPKYVRYYCATSESNRRLIKGMYVERSYFEASEIPEGGIVVVDGEREIPAPYDAGCSVVFVSYDPRRAAKVYGFCSAELIL